MGAAYQIQNGRLMTVEVSDRKRIEGVEQVESLTTYGGRSIHNAQVMQQYATYLAQKRKANPYQKRTLF